MHKTTEKVLKLACLELFHDIWLQLSSYSCLNVAKREMKVHVCHILCMDKVNKQIEAECVGDFYEF